jgi:hypothetical protein
MPALRLERPQRKRDGAKAVRVTLTIAIYSLKLRLENPKSL